MSFAKTEFIKRFEDRGYLYQATDLEKLKFYIDNVDKPVAYIGFDCTASSLHVGSLVQIMILRLLRKSGFRVIVIFGDGTTRIGDPSGRDKTRQILTNDDIANNISGIKEVVGKFIDFNDPDIVVCNNNQWLGDLNYIEFLRDIGKFFSVNQMLNYESVKIRLERESHLSFLEFNYMILQAYDFVELQKRYDCRIQIGGSDQWGNIVNGIELYRRINEDAGNKGYGQLFGLTTALITNADGSKMGKTASGAVWLSEELLSPYDYYQFWRNVDDRDVVRFLKLFTELELDVINDLAKLEGAEINEAKKKLAFACTELCHGTGNAIMAAKAAESVFEKNIVSDNLPTIYVTPENIAEGVRVISLFVDSNIVGSKGEIKRLIKGNGASLNDVKIQDENYIISMDDFHDDVMKISAGKKKHALVKIK